MNDLEQWEADMDAWGLTDTRRVHHLWRLHAYHRRTEAVHWRRCERADRAQAWIALAVLVAVVVELVLL
jgi:hypothetical protein